MNTEGIAVDDSFQALLRLAQQGDHQAQLQLLTPHTREIANQIRARSPRLAALIDREDVVQQVFLSAIVALPDYKPRGRGVLAFKGWLIRIAKHVMLDFNRSEHTRKRGGDANRVDSATAQGYQQLLMQLASDGTTPSQGLSRNELVRCMNQATGKLLPNHREVIELVDLQGQSLEAAAANLGIHISAARGRLKRGRAALKAQWNCDFPNFFIEEL